MSLIFDEEKSYDGKERGLGNKDDKGTEAESKGWHPNTWSPQSPAQALPLTASLAVAGQLGRELAASEHCSAMLPVYCQLEESFRLQLEHSGLR